MFNFRPSLSYANVTATLALVLSMSGGALAASHYLINSTSQINPKVLKALKATAGTSSTTGPAGPAGPAGAAGPAGKEGAAGQNGHAGEPGKPGEPGKTGEPGARGEKGDPGSALAYAHIEADGKVEATESKGVSDANVVRPEERPGVYCISGLAVAPHNAVATIDDSKSSWVATSAKTSIGVGYKSECAAGTQVTVETLDEDSEEEAGFYLELN